MSSRCPSPPCPVVGLDELDLRRRQLVTWPVGTVLERVAEVAHRLASLNPSKDGRGRFSPLGDRDHAYVARRRTVALLETVFHDVGAAPASRVIYQSEHLDGLQVGTVRTIEPLRLVDLRDDALQHLGARRDQLVTTTPAHYPCTTAIGAALAGWAPAGRRVDGLVWHSRVAEIGQRGSALGEDLLHGEVAEVAVLYGVPGSVLLHWIAPATRLLQAVDQWPPLVDEVAELLDAEIH